MAFDLSTAQPVAQPVAQPSGGFDLANARPSGGFDLSTATVQPMPKFINDVPNPDYFNQPSLPQTAPRPRTFSEAAANEGNIIANQYANLVNHPREALSGVGDAFNALVQNPGEALKNIAAAGGQLVDGFKDNPAAAAGQLFPQIFNPINALPIGAAATAAKLAAQGTGRVAATAGGAAVGGLAAGFTNVADEGLRANSEGYAVSPEIAQGAFGMGAGLGGALSLPVAAYATRGVPLFKPKPEEPTVAMYAEPSNELSKAKIVDPSLPKGQPYESIGGRKPLLHVPRAADSGQSAPFPDAYNKDQISTSSRSGQSDASSLLPPAVFSRGSEPKKAAEFYSKSGDFGPILSGYKHRAKEAISKLKGIQDGEATSALYHPDVGDIDLVWGKEGSGKSDGFGLAKLVKYHPEVVADLQGILSRMSVVRKTENRISLESKNHEAGISLNWFGKEKKWLLTAYKKALGEPQSIDGRPLKRENGSFHNQALDETIYPDQSLDKDGKVKPVPPAVFSRSSEPKKDKGSVLGISRDGNDSAVKGVVTVAQAEQTASVVATKQTDVVGMAIARVLKRGGTRHSVEVADSFSAFKDSAPVIYKEGKKQGGEKGIQGVFHDGKVYLVKEALSSAPDVNKAVERVLLHEFTHADMRQLYQGDLGQRLDDLFVGIGGIDGIERIARKNNIDLSNYSKADRQSTMDAKAYRRLMVDELLAHIGQESPSLKKKVKEIIGRIRQWLRDKGLLVLSKLGETDLLNVLRQARQAAVKNTEQGTRFYRATEKSDAPVFSRDASKTATVDEKMDGDQPFTDKEVDGHKAAAKAYLDNKTDGVKDISYMVGKAFYFRPVQVIRDIGTQAAKTLADLIYKEERHEKRAVRGADLIQRRTAKEGEYGQRLAALLDTLSTKDGKALIEGLNSPKGIIALRLKPQFTTARKILDDMQAYQKEAGVDIGLIKNYFPRVYDIASLSQSKRAFLRMLERNGIKDGDSIFRKIVEGEDKRLYTRKTASIDCLSVMPAKSLPPRRRGAGIQSFKALRQYLNHYSCVRKYRIFRYSFKIAPIMLQRASTGLIL